MHELADGADRLQDTPVGPFCPHNVDEDALGRMSDHIPKGRLLVAPVHAQQFSLQSAILTAFLHR